MNSLSHKYILFILFLFTVIGLELRITFIDLPLWYDEAQSVLIANKSFPFQINNYLFIEDLQHTPFYFYLLHFWIKLFGESDVVLKILSLLFGIAAIPLTYILANKVSDKKTALIAAGIMTFNSFNIVYSTEVRMYSLIVVLSVLSMIFLFDFFDNKGKNTLIKLSLINILIPYTLTGAFIFVITQFLAIMFFYRKNEKFKLYLLSNIFVFAALIPYFIIILGFALKRSEFLLTHVTPFSLANVFGILQNFFAPHPGTIFWATLNPFFINLFSVSFVFIPVFLCIYYCFLAVKTKETKVSLIFTIVLLSLILAVCFAVNKTIVLAPRYLIFLSPLLIVLLSVGFAKIKNKWIAAFLVYYAFSSMYYVFTDVSVRALKSNALLNHIKYIKSKNLTSEDMVIMPFASSVIGHYTDKNSPKIPRIEAIQELRIYNNKNIYSDEIIQSFKSENINNVFQKIILSDDYISQNFKNYILNTFVNPVKKGRYILFSIFTSDAEILISENDLKTIYSDIKNIESDKLNAILSKYFLDIHKIVREKAKLVNTEVIDGNVYFLYKKL